MSNTLKTAICRRIDGDKLTQVDQRELAKHDKAEAERLLQAVPRVLVRRMTGLTQGQLEQRAKRYGLPMGGDVVDMYQLLPAVLVALESDDIEAGAGDSPALERLRAAKAAMAEIDLEQRRGSVASVEEVRTRLTDIAAIIRTHGEAMVRAGGPAVQRAFDDMIDELEDAVNRWYDTTNNNEKEIEGNE